MNIIYRCVVALAVTAGPLAGVTSSSAVAASIDQAPRSLTSVRFTFKSDGAVRGGFALSASRLMFGTDAGTVYALDSRNGAPMWRSSLGSPINSVPASDGSQVYFTSADNALHALDERSGRQRWVRRLGANVGTANYWDYYTSSPVIVGGSIYVGSGDGHLYSLDRRSGKVLWSSDAGSRVRTTPAVAGDAVVFGTMSGHVVAVDRLSGRPLWKFATEGAAHDFAFKDNDSRSVITAPIIEDGLVVAGGRDGNLYGIDLASGAERWHQTHDGGSWILGVAPGPGRFYSSSGSAFIVQAADLTTGKEIWRTPTAANAMFGGIVSSGDVLVSNGLKGNLFAFDAVSGRELWRYRLADTAFGTPKVGGGAVFTASDDGSVYALNTSTASPQGVRRLVYSFTDQQPEGFFWFAPDTLQGISGSFAAAGYTRIGNDELTKALRETSTTGDRTIVAIADTRLPDGVDAALVRRFLDAGGTMVLLGINPLDYTFDAKTGAPETVDYEKGAAGFGITAMPRELDFGYNVSRFTTEGAQLGLTGHFVSSGPTSPDQVSMVLARDPLGMATAWAKQYQNGGLLMQLPVSRNRPSDLSAYINTIQLAAAASAEGALAPPQ